MVGGALDIYAKGQINVVIKKNGFRNIYVLFLFTKDYYKDG